MILPPDHMSPMIIATACRLVHQTTVKNSKIITAAVSVTLLHILNLKQQLFFLHFQTPAVLLFLMFLG